MSGLISYSSKKSQVTTVILPFGRPLGFLHREGRKGECGLDVAESPGSSRPEAPKSLQLSVQLEGLSVFSIRKEGRVDVNESSGSSGPEAPKSPQLSVQLEGLSIFSIRKEGRLDIEESPGSSGQLEE